ncbi:MULTISPECIES: histidine phosphatase family protein [Sphingobacterium]|uniref:SixA phosphatase family protein n=1 Tax=Sphingobacterium TaxID=28453 RepID=UPI00162A7424|nr:MULTISPECIES: histidine phosphatase family protein [Sphingobacterium]MBV2228393.1 histidine phosphatase family protein [Sphingobacterium mizutaii]
MKTLYLIRHAKAEEHSFSKDDFYRDLQKKGRERAERIAQKLKDSLKIDEKTLVISSSANRAIQTAELFCEVLGYPQESIHQTRDIYEAHFMDILKVINSVPEEYDTLLIFGHNPGLSNLTNYLSHSEIELATSNVSILQLEGDLTFEMLGGGTANLIGLLK